MEGESADIRKVPRGWFTAGAFFTDGGVAQLGERQAGSLKVMGSIPITSTIQNPLQSNAIARGTPAGDCICSDTQSADNNPALCGEIAAECSGLRCIADSFRHAADMQDAPPGPLSRGELATAIEALALHCPALSPAELAKILELLQ